MMPFSSTVKNRTDGFEPVPTRLQESPSPMEDTRDTTVLVNSARSDDEPRAETDHARQPTKKPTPPVPAPNAANKILFLDGLRGLAAMMVIVQHAGYMGVFIGQPAVDTFFVLSAFLLTMIFEKKARTLMQEQASRRRWGWALLDYFMRRFLRVYPLFVLVAVIVSFYPPVLREQIYHVHHRKEYNLFKVLTFQFSSRYHVFWTLPLEISYYFIIPLFVVALLALKKFWWVPLLPLSFYVVYAGFYFYRMDHLGLGPHLPTFLVGSISAMVYAKMEQWIKRTKFEFRWYHWLALRAVEMFFLALLFSVLFGGLVFSWFFKNPVPHISGAPFISVNISIVIVCEMLLQGVVASVLEWSLLRYAGKISFSMYLMHSFVIYQTWVKKQGFWNRFYLNFGLTFLLSSVTYHLVEYPCQVAAARLGARIKQRDVRERQRTLPTLPVSEEKLHA